MNPWDAFLDAIEHGDRSAMRRAMQNMALRARILHYGDYA